ncbi:MAG: hypothetical protein HKN08_05015, partial [Gammaproteobacteria bacterium]|nr:hypothetical protein [Gammaproteobacteria bacterium]
MVKKKTSKTTGKKTTKKKAKITRKSAGQKVSNKNADKKKKARKKTKENNPPKIMDAYHENDPRLRGVKEKKLPGKYYEKELFRLQVELVKLQE